MFDLNINMELYRVFYVTAHTGSMTKAAQKLYIGQPAVSKAIKTIETTFGVALFNRTPKGITLTDEGQIFYNHISNAMEQINLAEQSLGAAKKKDKVHIKIEICAMQYRRLILPHIKTFFESCNDNEFFDISPTTDSFLSIKQLKEGKIDCCMVTNPLTDDSLQFIKLYTYTDWLMGSPDYIKVITKDGQDIVNNAVFISIMNEGIMSYYEKMRLKNLHFASKMKVTSMEHTISLAKLGCGIGFVAEELVGEELEKKELVKIENLPYLRTKREVGFLLNKNQKENESLMKFIDFYLNMYSVQAQVI